MTRNTNKNQEYANGAIVRIKLENFVTYDSLEFYPGPNLNVIIGPNGTGKSTIVCAICLGMTGKPSVLGRAANISDYIKYGRNKAIVEIELFNPNGSNFVVRRALFKDNKSEWFLNDKPAKLKDIEELVNNLNIQVGNLCQFLPQEKVSEFARMNAQELLENTEKAVGGLELHEKHMELKERSKKSRDLERDLKMLEETLEKEKNSNERIQEQVKHYLEKKKNEEEASWLKKKRACYIYKQKKQNYEEMKKKKDNVGIEYDEVNRRLQPLEEQKGEIEKQLAKQKQVINSKSSLVQEASRSSLNILKKLDDYTDKIAELKTNYLAKENEFKGHKTKLKEVQSAIEALKNQYDDAKEGLNDILKEEAQLNTQELGLRKEIDQIFTNEYEKKQELARHTNEIEEIRKKVSNLNNVKEEKMNKLRQANKDVYSAIKWLDENRGKFNGRVYEPIFFLINVKNPQLAKYIENLIPFRDLAEMFLFELSEDMSFFIRQVRNNLDLKVNCALIPNPVKYKLENFNPSFTIDRLRDFGFRTYAREAMEGPEAVLTYLCLYHHIHQIPIGNEKTQEKINDVVSQMDRFGIQRLFTNTHQYSITRSRYTGKNTTSSSQVPESYWLSSSVNTSALNELERKEKEVLEKIKTIQMALNEILKDKRQVETKLESLRAEKQKLREKKLYIDSLEKKLSAKRLVLNQLKNQNINLVNEAKHRLEKTVDICKLRAKVYTDYVDSTKNLMMLNKDKIIAVYSDCQYQNEKIKIESELRILQNKKLELQPFIEDFQNALKMAKEEASRELEAASKIVGHDLRQNLPNEIRAKFKQIKADTVEAIETELAQLDAMAQSSADVDGNIVEVYENRKKVIEKLQKEFEKQSDKLKNHQSNYETIKNQWLEEVENMIKELNVKFSTLFKQLRCSGEISLGRPDNTEDFSKYGITIKVSFRTDEQLQELTAWQQSGGEKSVSTMLYMIALQEMTKCPFRVVDEINQGMDPVNERKVFDIIVQNSCSKQFAQYFLLTPKLLPDLQFDDRSNIICVFNGPHNLPHTKYNLQRFLEIKKRLNIKTE